MKKGLVFGTFIIILALLAAPQFAGAMAQTGMAYTDQLQKLGFGTSTTKISGGTLIRTWFKRSGNQVANLLAIEDQKTGCLIKFSILVPKGFPEKSILEAASRGFISLALSVSGTFPPKDVMARDVARLEAVVRHWWRSGEMNVVKRFPYAGFQCQVARTDNNCVFVMGLPGV